MSAIFCAPGTLIFSVEINGITQSVGTPVINTFLLFFMTDTFILFQSILDLRDSGFTMGTVIAWDDTDH